MRSSYFPSKDIDFAEWIRNFRAKIELSPAALGLSVGQVAAFGLVADAWDLAFGAVADPATRTSGKIATKNEARRIVKQAAALLVSIIQGQETVTDEQKIDLRITVRRHPTPQPAPATAPVVEVVSVTGHVVRLRLHDATSTRRGRPAGVVAAAIYSFTGPTPPPPAEIHRWTSEGDVSRPHAVDVIFPTSVPDGAQVWFCAQWMNAKMERSPASSPISTNLAGGGVSAEAAMTEPVESQPQLKAA